MAIEAFNFARAAELSRAPVYYVTPTITVFTYVRNNSLFISAIFNSHSPDTGLDYYSSREGERLAIKHSSLCLLGFFHSVDVNLAEKGDY